MAFKERIYKRRDVTAIRESERQALIDSNLICLRLTLRFDPRVAIMPHAFRNDGFLTNGPCCRQNFAFFTVANRLGNRIVVHGRELFSPQAAECYFMPNANPHTFDASQFGEAARRKVRAAFSPESFSERLADYVKPDNPVDALKQSIKEFHEEFPDFKLPEHPPITEANHVEVGNIICMALEAQGIELDSLVQRWRFPPDADIRRNEQKVKEMTLKAFGGMFRQDSDLKAPLLAYLESHRYDPEILNNFMAGVCTREARGKPLDEILAIGIEERTNRTLRQLAEQMSNPYEPVFADAERHIADVLVHSVQPRVLRNALRRRTAIVVTDHQDVDTLHDVLSHEHKKTQGIYHIKTPDHAPLATDFIALAAPRLNYENLGELAAHEFEHHRDMTRPMFFAATHKENLSERVAGDLQNIAEIRHFLEGYGSRSDENDKKRLLDLAAVRFRPDSQPPTRLGIRAQLLSEVTKVQILVQESFKPLGGQAVATDPYSTRHAARAEIPAVLEQTRQMVGHAFVKHLLPRLHEVYRLDRLSSDNLRLRSDSAPGPTR